MHDKQNLKREGDINVSPLRTEWMKQLTAKSLDIIRGSSRRDSCAPCDGACHRRKFCRGAAGESRHFERRRKAQESGHGWLHVQKLLRELPTSFALGKGCCDPPCPFAPYAGRYGKAGRSDGSEQRSGTTNRLITGGRGVVAVRAARLGCLGRVVAIPEQDMSFDFKPVRPAGLNISGYPPAATIVEPWPPRSLRHPERWPRMCHGRLPAIF